MSVGTEKSVLVNPLEYEIRASICSLHSYNPVIKQGDSHILVTIKSYVMDGIHSFTCYGRLRLWLVPAALASPKCDKPDNFRIHFTYHKGFLLLKIIWIQ